MSSGLPGWSIRDAPMMRQYAELFEFREGKITTASTTATMTTTPIAATGINQRRSFIPPERR